MDKRQFEINGYINAIQILDKSRRSLSGIESLWQYTYHAGNYLNAQLKLIIRLGA